MKKITYNTIGTCSKAINVELDGDVVHNVEIVGGCPGNTQGVCRLVRGKRVDEVIALLDGILCGAKPTSCPDQLACALRAATAEPLTTEQAEQQGRATARAIAAIDHTDTLQMQRAKVKAYAQRSAIAIAGNDLEAEAFDDAFLDELRQCDPQLAASMND